MRAKDVHIGLKVTYADKSGDILCEVLTSSLNEVVLQAVGGEKRKLFRIKPGQYGILPGVVPYDPAKDQTVKELAEICREAKILARQKPANPFDY